MWKAAARWGLFGLAVLAPVLGATACSSGNAPDVPRVATATTTTPATASARTTETVPDGTERVLPDTLVGSWNSVEEAGEAATIAYRFTGDGRYKYVGLISYPVPEGVVKVTFVAEGTARVDGSELRLQPVTATRSMEDPRAPQDNYADKPSSLDPERYVWRVTEGVLGLTGEDGNTVPYRRTQL